MQIKRTYIFTFSYLVEVIQSSHSSDFPTVISKSNIGFGGRIKLKNAHVSKSSDKFSPNISPQAITHSKSYHVVLIVVFLEKGRSQFQKSAADFSVENKQIKGLSVLRVIEAFCVALPEGMNLYLGTEYVALLKLVRYFSSCVTSRCLEFNSQNSQQ